MLIKDDRPMLSPTPATCPFCRSSFLLPRKQRWWQRWLGSRRRFRCQGCGATLKPSLRRRR